MDNTRIRAMCLSGAEISSAAWGITLNPIKKKGVITATAKVFFIISCVEAPMNSCPCRFASLPVKPDAAMRTMPTPPMTKVKTVCKIAAVFAPIILIYVIKTTRKKAKANQVAYISKPPTVYK